MTHRETDLDQLTTLLGQCLGRIDEQAYRLQRSEEEGEDYEACDALEREAGLLQELVSSVMEQSSTTDDADLNRTIDHSLRSCVADYDKPVVVRTNFAQQLPRIACAPSQLSFAVQRALTLALGSVEAGGEIAATTRLEGDAIWLEIEAEGAPEEAHFAERAATLAEFVAGFQGSCRIDSDGRGTCLIAMQLPAALIS